jgi:glycosyltransferase involved in cell wall biosynthesis
MVSADSMTTEPAAESTTESTIVPGGAKPGPVVLQILPALETGGVERGTVDITGALVAAGGTALVASSGGHMVREVQRAGGTHLTLPVDSKNPFVMRANVGRLRRVIAEHGVDLVHARSRAPAWSALAATRAAGVPLVTTFHGTYGAGWPGKRWYNSVMTRGVRVIAISDFIADHIASVYGTGPERVRVIPRGMDMGVFDPKSVSAERLIRLSNRWRLPDGAPVIMLPGRITGWKGQHVLVEAMARLGRRDVRCLLVGENRLHAGYLRKLDSRIQRLGLADTVHIVGHCDDMAAAYMLADVVVSTSVEAEAFGRIVAEAQAMGRPVIATDHGAARETLVAGETGWLVPPGDASALVDALKDALAIDAAARQVLAQRAVRHVRANFTRELMGSRTLEVYAEVLAEAAAS